MSFNGERREFVIKRVMNISYCKNKRDFIIEKQIVQNLCNTQNVYQTTLPFYATQINNPFLSSIISANHEKGRYCPSSVESFLL